ncbi:hypothetical protein EON80_08650 [bacterium]|nr:MAG: hypothetical protein EON80_08650 [bacterium]
MAEQPVITQTREELVPFQQPQTAKEVSGQFAPNLDLPAGQTLAFDSAAKKLIPYNEAGSDTDTNEVQTITLSGTPASGAFTLGVPRGGLETTANIPWDGNSAAITAALNALPNVAPGDIVAVRATNVLTFTYGAAWAGSDVPPIVFTPVNLQTSAPAPVTGTVATTTPGVDATTGTAVGLTRYAVQTDAQGNVTNFDENGALEDTAPYYYTGIFRTTHLNGFTAAALNDLQGRVIQGTLADGVIKF